MGLGHKQLLMIVVASVAIPANGWARDVRSIHVLSKSDDLDAATQAIAIARLEQMAGCAVKLFDKLSAMPADTDLRVILGVHKSPRLEEAKPDSFVVETTSTDPLTVLVSGKNRRSTLYAVYRLADLLKAEADLADIKLFLQPKIAQRYVSFGATTHGRRFYRPQLYWKTLHEAPQFAYSGVIIYPGGGTPLGRRASPVATASGGALQIDPQQAPAWRNWFAKIDAYGLDIMMTVPPVIPAGYERRLVADFYAGGPEPPGYLDDLRRHFRQYLSLLNEAYPSIDRFLFNSTEGATFGRNRRFFGRPDEKRFSSDAYVKNNKALMRTYFDVLAEFFGDDLGRVCFWTHSFGLTSDGIRAMREVLFEYPQVTIVEDDFWNNNLWPFDLPAMAYLPQDLRAEVTSRNPLALFQIATDGEYYGGGSLPNSYPDAHVRSAQEAIKLGAKMVIQRLDLHDRTPYGTAFGSMEIVPLAASRQYWEPTPPLADLWSQWAASRFGRAAAPHVVAALQKSETVLHRGLSWQGLDLLAVGSEFNPRLWKRGADGLSRYHLFGRPGRRLLQKKPGEAILSAEYTAYQMQSRTAGIDAFRQNQAAARAAVREGLREIELARPALRDSDYAMLHDIFENGEHVLEAMRLLGELAYATNLVVDNFANGQDPHRQFAESRANLDAYLKKGSLIPPMTKNLRSIMSSYQEIAREAIRDD